jgi:hypothetical protein
MPTKLYITNATQLLRYDVLTKSMQVVFDVATQWGSDKHIQQTTTSNDDDVHVATLQDANYAALGCVAHKESTNQYFYYPAQGEFDECQVDKSGRYVIIKEKTPTTCATCDVDNIIIDLTTGSQTLLTDQNGAGGHSDLGYGWYLSTDNWAPQANSWRIWQLGQPLTQGLALSVGNLLQGGVVYHDLNWNVFEPSHISWENASPTTPIGQQYACGGGANTTLAPHANEIVCFLLGDTLSLQAQEALVVAPVMTDLNATGGNATCPGCEAYAKDPKGNIDPTGQYFFWVSNMGGSRMDAFIVQIPSQLLTGAAPVPPPPAVSITAPTAGTTVSNTVTLSANATDSVAIASVQYQLDGANLGAAAKAAPYSVSWDTSTTTAGSHVLVAVLQDSAGNTLKSSPVTVTVASVTPTPAPSPSPTPTPAAIPAPVTTPAGAAGASGGGAFDYLSLLLLPLLLGLRSRRYRTTQ